MQKVMFCSIFVVLVMLECGVQGFFYTGNKGTKIPRLGRRSHSESGSDWGLTESAGKEVQQLATYIRGLSLEERTWLQYLINRQDKTGKLTFKM